MSFDFSLGATEARMRQCTHMWKLGNLTYSSSTRRAHYYYLTQYSIVREMRNMEIPIKDATVSSLTFNPGLLVP